MTMANFEEWLTQAARKSGAHSAASIRMDNPLLRQAIAENKHLVETWLAAGKQGEMTYLQTMLVEKSNPWTRFPFARSVIVLSFTNHWGALEASHPFPLPRPGALVGYVSAYARENDYHLTGQTILSRLKAQLGENIQAQATVDTAAVFERVFATVGGLGEIGVNGLLRDPSLGTRVFIGCLFVDQELPEVILDPALPFACSTCHVCVAHCPSGALCFDQQIDARKCISYLTIEKRGILNSEEQVVMGSWIFGCDDCTSVCPPTLENDQRIAVDLEWLLKSSSGDIRRTIKGNATAYAGVTQLRRNAVVVLKNNGSARAHELLDWVRQHSGSELILKQLEFE